MMETLTMLKVPLSSATSKPVAVADQAAMASAAATLIDDVISFTSLDLVRWLVR